MPSLSLPPDDAGPAGIEGLCALGGGAAVRGAGGPGPTRVRVRANATARPSPRSADASTGSRWPSNWLRPGCGCSPPPRSPTVWRSGSGCLTGAARTALPRQQTLEASLDWSHALLTDAEQIVFRRLGVFAGGFDLDAAMAVCAGGAIEPWQVLDLLTLLVDKNLVAVDDSGAIARYRLLETMRLYAHRRLDTAGELTTTPHPPPRPLPGPGRNRGPALETADGAAWSRTWMPTTPTSKRPSPCHASPTTAPSSAAWSRR